MLKAILAAALILPSPVMAQDFQPLLDPNVIAMGAHHREHARQGYKRQNAAQKCRVVMRYLSKLHRPMTYKERTAYRYCKNYYSVR